MKHTGLLFGSFNPLHNGHIQLALHAQKEAQLDEVWFVVQPENNYKPSFTLMDVETRQNLIEASGLRLYRPKSTDYAHYVPATIKELKDYEVTLILGGDLAESFAQWPDYAEITSLAKVYTLPRFATVSSGLVRDRLEAKQPIDDLVPRVVSDYLQQHLR